jgi:hypothetical protein
MILIHDDAAQRYTLNGGTDISVRTGQDQPGSTVPGVLSALDGHLVIAAQVDAWVRPARLIGVSPLAADASLHHANRLKTLARDGMLHAKPTVADLV